MSTSRSASSTNANQTQTTNTSNLNLQDNEGITIGDASGSLSITTTDFGSIAAATDISHEAIGLGRDSLEYANDGLRLGADLAGRGLDNAFAFGRDTVSGAFDFGTHSLDKVASFADVALDTNADLARDSLSTVADFAGSAGAGVLDFARNLVGDTVSGFKDLSMQTSATTDDRVAKIAMWAFTAVAAAVVLPQLFKS